MLATLDLEALPEAARTVLLAQAAELQAMREDNAELAALNARLEHLVREFQQALYGRKSEKLDPEQRDLLFEDLETAIAEVEAEKEKRTRPSNTRPPARNIGRLPKHLPRIERVIEPADTNCPCGCGPMAKIGEDRSERLDIVPAQFRVIETVRPRYACRACLGRIAQAPAPAHLIESALPTEALLAHVIVAKFADHCPLYVSATSARLAYC